MMSDGSQRGRQMGIRKILAPVDGSEGSRSVVQTAFAVARRLGAHVRGVHVSIDPTQAVPFVGEGMSGALVQELVELSERENTARAAAARELFDRLQTDAVIPTAPGPTAEGPSAAWAGSMAWDGGMLIRQGRLADLIVVARPAPAGADADQVTLTRALFETGRPVLVAGPAEAESLGERIIIAWNGGIEAARATTAALPFLASAERVTAVGVRGEPDDDDRGLAEVAEYLAWHGILARTHPVITRAPVGEALLDSAVAMSADLVVMGGYSHGRLRELILGGVTRHMLEKAALPLLVAH
jgi:nucleotide-binding universal stress UspA family protein